MTTRTYTATERRNNNNLASAHGPAHSMKTLTSTVEITGGATAGTTVDFGNIPSDARISGLSRVYNDDLATTGSPTLDIGLGAVDGNLVNSDDPDAIGNGFALSSANTGASAVSEIANIGLPAWDLVASETADPGGVLQVYGTIADAATTTGATGTVTLELLYYVD